MNHSYDTNPGEAIFELYVRKGDRVVIAIPRIPVCRGCRDSVDEELRRTVANFEEHGYEYLDTLYIPHADLSKIGKAQELSRIQGASTIASDEAQFKELMNAITEYYLEEEKRMALQGGQINTILSEYRDMIHE